MIRKNQSNNIQKNGRKGLPQAEMVSNSEAELYKQGRTLIIIDGFGLSSDFQSLHFTLELDRLLKPPKLNM